MRNISIMVATAVVAAVLAAGTGASAQEPAQASDVVNINTATAVELAFLPGVGPARADDIVAQRQVRPFQKPEDITKVKGIGRKSFQKMRPHITVSGPTTAKAKIKLPK
ncbi:MAG: helix-hairpin-helix domain-containing protein [Deltaproteobacteria bacterium]|nr:helix-hairpin-helix domain-containing protein [Deltaproteobacteria bacterium]